MRRSAGCAMALQWIAERLHTGSSSYLSNLLNSKPPGVGRPQSVLPLFHQ
jgi:hypothetical protein